MRCSAGVSGMQIMTTAYAGAIEVQITATQRITKAYYSAGGQLIAMRVYTSPTNSVPYYLHGDHLGSTSLTTNASGNVVARQLYDAWGSIRSGGSMPTDIAFTGQRGNLEVGLLFYRARFYAPGIMRFISADTIVPEPKNPQTLNRYAYGLNNPVRYIDPSGHYTEDELLNKFHVFNGPNQMQQLKEDPNNAFWYWVLRAAGDGDNLSGFGSEVSGFNIMGSSTMNGQFKSASDSLMFVTASGDEFQVRWNGFVDPSDSEHSFNFRPDGLTKSDGTTLTNLNAARRYTRLQEGGARKPLDFDYVQGGLGAYVGVGGGFSFRVDRYGHVYLTLSGGFGLGGKGAGLTTGMYTTEYVPDPGELQGYISGNSVTGGCSIWGAGNLSQPAEGPAAFELGASFPGAALTLDVTIPLW
jgi:RHS repeat-associated protein